jgi:S1-C subfamily serine protease
MEKMLLKHIEGSKSGQTERFDLPLNCEVLFGRDPSSQIVFDSNKDDLVSRLHARLSQDHTDKTIFIITDLNSRNGTYVNGMRITGPAMLNPGDILELGSGGAKIEFDLDPRPAAIPPATRIFSATNAEGPGTRVATPMSFETPCTPMQQETPISMRRNGISRPDTPASGVSGTNTVGRATVERMINQTKSSNKKLITAISAGLVVLVALISGGVFLYQQKKAVSIELITKNLVIDAQNKSKQELQAVNDKVDQAVKIAESNEAAVNAGAIIAEKYNSSVVFIQESWKLIFTPSGTQCSQAFFNVKELGELLKGVGYSNPKLLKDINEVLQPGSPETRFPTYIKFGSVIEPYIVTDSSSAGTPIGGSSSGSGFVVDKGFILTNKHVAAAWAVPYFQNGVKLPGFLIVCADAECSDINNVAVLERNERSAPVISALMGWVPSNTKMLGGKPARGKILEGRHDYLDIIFPKTTNEIHATLSTFSESADVALISVLTPHSTPPVTLCESDPCVKAGEMVTVMGYPGVSADVYGKAMSYEMGRGEGNVRIIPEPTTTRGEVQKIISGEVEKLGGAISQYYSPSGEIIQLGINTTGHGNSGGPVFNDKGQVVGLFTYGWGDNGGANVTAAVPIKFGLDLMGGGQVIK